MKRPLALVGTLAVTVGVLAGTLAVPFASASSHREAPSISKDPSADNTDVYAFVSPDKPDTVTMVADYIPAEQAAGGPNFYEFDPTVLYEIHIHNGSGDDAGKNDEITYQFRFKTTVVNADTFLYNVGPISFQNGKYVNWNRPQTYSVTRVDEQGHSRRIANDVLVPPVNVGPRSTPGYDALAATAIKDLGEGRQVFAGQRDDPFFVDLGSIFDLLGLRPFNNLHAIPLQPGPGVDDVRGLSVHSIVLQVPITDLAHSHKALMGATDPNAVVGFYASASRKKTRVLDDEESRADDDPSQWVQVSRLGEPLINEVLIPMARKDRWNATDPVDDSRFRPFYLAPEPARLINGLYAVIGGDPNAHIDEKNRGDLVTVLLTGVPGLNFQGNKPMDLLRLNMAIAPTAQVGKGDRLGVLNGDVGGFPNGRRLEDDVVDIEVRAIAQGYGTFVNGLLGLPNKVPNDILTDGVDSNEKAFQMTFPYLSSPVSGYEEVPAS